MQMWYIMGMNQVLIKFYQGHYLDLIQELENRSIKHIKGCEFPYYLGALSFVGRLKEANTLFHEYNSSLKIKEIIRCYFFLGIAHTRSAEY